MDHNRIQTSLPIPSMAGLAIWLGSVVWLQPDWAAALLLLAPLVAVPLAMSLLNRAAPSWLGVASALFLIPAYACGRGPAAAGFTLPWLALCAGFALRELCQWRRRRDTAMGLIKGFLVVGAGWLFLARLGARPLGFEDVIVHATAVHFHYAGFLLPLLLLLLTRADPAPTTRWALWGVLAGMPLVAAGITLSVWEIRWLEGVATLFMASACWLAAWRQARFAASLTTRLSRAMLLASAAALATAMILACAYALGRCRGTPWLDIPLMVRLHGSLQVFGFVLPALGAWWILERDRADLSLLPLVSPVRDNYCLGLGSIRPSSANRG